MFFEHLLLNSLNTMLGGSSEGKPSSQMQLQDIDPGSVQSRQWRQPAVSEAESIKIRFLAIGKSTLQGYPKPKILSTRNCPRLAHRTNEFSRSRFHCGLLTGLFCYLVSIGALTSSSSALCVLPNPIAQLDPLRQAGLARQWKMYSVTACGPNPPAGEGPVDRWG